MLNKFILSGVVSKVEEDNITFETISVNTKGMNITMKFDEKLAQKVVKDMEKNKVVLDVEGVLIPDENGQLNLAPQLVSTTNIPMFNEKIS